MTKILAQFKFELDFMQTWIDNLKTFINESHYEEDDIRKDYFYTSHTNVNHYYLSYINLFNSYIISTGNFAINKKIANNFRGHFDRLIFVTRHPSHCQAHFNTLNQRVFVMAWSLFELSISTFYEHIVEDTELNRQYSELYREVLKNVKVEEGKEEKVKKLLIQSSLHQISIGRKYNYLIKKADGYSRNKAEDKAFLEFFGKMRNTIHSNFIYYGKNYKYRFGDSEFIFTNQKQVVWSDPFEKHKLIPSVELYFHLIGQLNSIANEIFKCNPCEEKINYPDLNAD